VVPAPEQRLTTLGFIVLVPKKKTTKDGSAVKEDEEEGEDKSQLYHWSVVLGGT
jgi:hypothetical protein